MQITAGASASLIWWVIRESPSGTQKSPAADQADVASMATRMGVAIGWVGFMCIVIGSILHQRGAPAVDQQGVAGDEAAQR